MHTEHTEPSRMHTKPFSEPTQTPLSDAHKNLMHTETVRMCTKYSRGTQNISGAHNVHETFGQTASKRQHLTPAGKTTKNKNGTKTCRTKTAHLLSGVNRSDVEKWLFRSHLSLSRCILDNQFMNIPALQRVRKHPSPMHTKT